MAVEINQLETSAKEKMAKSVSVFKSDLATIRAGRANPQVLDKNYCRLLRCFHTY